MNQYIPEKKDISNKCVESLNQIGISTIFRKIEGDSFLPGIVSRMATW